MTNSNFKVSWSNTLPGEARGSLLEARFIIRYVQPWRGGQGRGC